MKILSIDAETNGLWGKPFAIAGIVYELKTLLCVFRVEKNLNNKIVDEKLIGVFNGDLPKDYTLGGNLPVHYSKFEHIVKNKDVFVEVDKICLRLNDSVVTNDWVVKNVLPTLKNIKVTNKTYLEMLEEFSKFYMKYKDSTVLYHMGHVVESYLFRELVKNKFIGEWDTPYTPIEVSEVLRQNNFKPDSVDEVVKNYGLNIKEYGTTHNPLYDCEVAFKVWEFLKYNYK